MIIYYGSFLKLLKEAQKWKNKEIIDVEWHYKKRDALKELNKSKLQSPIIVIDPVDQARNAAAALSSESLEIFRSAAKAFLKKPSAKFFQKEKITADSLRKKAGSRKLVLIKITPPRGKEDIVGGKLARAFRTLKSELARQGFNAAGGFELDEDCLFWFFTPKKALGNWIAAEGPLKMLEAHAAEFRKKHRNAYLKKGRLYAKAKRSFTRPENLIRHMLKHDKGLRKKINKASVKVY